MRSRKPSTAIPPPGYLQSKRARQVLAQPPISSAETSDGPARGAVAGQTRCPRSSLPWVSLPSLREEGAHTWGAGLAISVSLTAFLHTYTIFLASCTVLKEPFEPGWVTGIGLGVSVPLRAETPISPNRLGSNNGTHRARVREGRGRGSSLILHTGYQRHRTFKRQLIR